MTMMMMMMMMRQVRNQSKALVRNADSSAWNYDEDGKDGWSGQPEDGENSLSSFNPLCPD